MKDHAVKVGMVSLGCPKNLVDSEVMLGQLAAHQFQVTNDPEDAELLIVNTCGFIDKAKQESVDTILEMAAYKKSGACKKLVVTGCLVQGYAAEMKKDLPEVDAFLGSADYGNIAAVVKGLFNDKRSAEPFMQVSNPAWLYDSKSPRILTTPSYMAYLKIAEGCDHVCAFCAIPKLRGKLRSRTVEDVVAEARALGAQGVKEINIISQDTSEYGRDIYKGEPRLRQLIEALDDVKGPHWFRLHYLYPAFLDAELMKVMSQSKRLAQYIDLPLQHGSTAMLKAMKRPGTREGNLKLLQRFKDAMPGAALRSSFIVGYPGETEEDFEQLLSFFAEAELDRIGVFTYSQETLTPSGAMEAQVSDKTKAKRLRLAMETAAALSEKRLRRFKGQTVEVLVERPSRSSDSEATHDGGEHGASKVAAAPSFRKKSKDLWIGRTQYDAPDIDGKVYFSPAKGVEIKPGQFVQVLVEQTTEHDLVGAQQP
jgi:ribosomal protein S12 methylthiotransferase